MVPLSYRFVINNLWFQIWPWHWVYSAQRERGKDALWDIFRGQACSEPMELLLNLAWPELTGMAVPGSWVARTRVHCMLSWKEVRSLVPRTLQSVYKY